MTFKSKNNAATRAHSLPGGFWWMILTAVSVGMFLMAVSLWAGAPDWLAVSAPIFCVGLVGVAIEYGKRAAVRRDGPENSWCGFRDRASDAERL
ncbi:hypothetical protein FIU86_06285 [Roseovarius sp. THAF9]|uniref:hypothetical protein n=1 Tax=Roseovarius sp. THAF9 TaxID=2587847 RepID=UPI00126831AB|nr:hypothetical protein [Roseovarius sp. THAF9]QFT92443.1 hypothetical protein FIU86_06285 [Roseovarius sp. THAF9]